MSDNDSIDWGKTGFDGSRHDQLWQAQAMTVRQRLEALDGLTKLSERMQTMPKTSGIAPGARSAAGVHEQQAGYQTENPCNEIVLAGCTPTPLANYLKALGVLRLLSAKYTETRGFWRGDRFVLNTAVDEQGIVDFFLKDYAPTPIMAPWNGGSGFFEKDNKSALEAIRQSTDPRLANYKSCLDVADTALADMDRTSSPKGDDKAKLLTRIRSQLPDEALSWFDASVLLAGEAAQYPPLLGTGGNDGRLDFTNNFMQCLTDVLGWGQKNLAKDSTRWLVVALLSEATPGLIKNAIGQFSPGQAGGPNATTGFGGTFQEANATINPWDFVLMIEGALVFAAAAVRRNAEDPAGVLSYPFTVRSVGAGAGNLGEGDAANARGELWMPLWNKPAAYGEIRSLLAEGRIALGRKPARDALDFVRAIHHLGGYRGVQSFQRYGLLMRSGKAYLATPLSRVEVSDEPQSNLLDELDNHQWLDRFRGFTRGDNTANRFRILRKQLEDQVFDLSSHEPTKAEMQSLIILLGNIQQVLASSSKARESVAPIPRLPERWVKAADDGSAEFRIAKALAGLCGMGDKPLPLRAQLFPVHRRFNQWMTPESGEKVRIYTSRKGRLVNILRTLLGHRLQLAERLEMKDKPLTSPAGATLEDMTAFLQDDRMDARIAALLPGLCLCDIPEDTEHKAGEGTLPAAFGLMKLVLTPDRTLKSVERKGVKLLSGSDSVPEPTGMLAQLAAGNHKNRAVEIAWRCLRASALTPRFTTTSMLPGLAGISHVRAAAALLVPLRYGATRALVHALLKEPETATEPVTTA